MQKTTSHTKQVTLITVAFQDAYEQINEEEVGFYAEHFINDRFDYTVKLDPSGRIEIPRAVAQDFDTNGLSTDALQKILASYRPE